MRSVIFKNKFRIFFKKRSTISERLDYANSIIEDILDSANRPFDGKLWWQKSGILLIKLKFKNINHPFVFG